MKALSRLEYRYLVPKGYHYQHCLKRPAGNPQKVAITIAETESVHLAQHT